MNIGQLRNIKQSREFRFGTFKIDETVEGRPTFSIPAMPDEIFHDVSDVLDKLSEIRFTSRMTFKPGLGMIPPEGTPSSPFGWYRYGPIETIADLWGEEAKVRGFINPTVVRDTFGIDSVSEDFIQDSIKKGGLPIVDTKKVNFLRLMYEDAEGAEKILDIDQTYKFLEDSIGLKVGSEVGGGKLMKRLKALINLRGFASLERVESSSDLYRVGVYDPASDTGFMKELVADLTQRYKGDDLSKAAIEATEGMNIVNRDSLVKLADNLDIEAEKIKNVAGSAGSREVIEQERIAKEMVDQAADLRKMVLAGRGRFNARVMGFIAEALPGESAETIASNLGIEDLSELTGQIKGDFLVGSRRFFSGEREGLDIVTSYKNIKDEISLRKARFFNIEEHNFRKNVFLDVQTLSSNPHLFDEEVLSRHMLEDIDEHMARILEDPLETKQGGGIKAMVEDVMGRKAPVDDPNDLARFNRTQSYARKISDAIEAGQDLNQRPDIISSFLNAYQDSFTKIGSRGEEVPKFKLPDTVSGAIVSSEHWQALDSPGLVDDLRPNQIAFSAQHESLILKGFDVKMAIETYGGWDSDDFLNVMLRYDKKNSRIRAIGYRQPNAMGEYGIHDVHSSAMRMFLKNKGIESEDIDRLLVQKDSLESKIRAARKDLGNIKSIAANPDVGPPKGPWGSWSEKADYTAKRIDALESQMDDLAQSIGIEEVKLESLAPRIGGNAKIGQLDEAGRFVDAAEGTFGPIYSETIDDVTGETDFVKLSDRFEYFQKVKDPPKGGVLPRGEEAARLISEEVEKLGQLEKFSNQRMLLEHFAGSGGVDKFDPDIKFRLLTQEQAIDALINPGAAGMQELVDGDWVDLTLPKLTEDIQRSLVRGIVQANIGIEDSAERVGLDPTLVAHKGNKGELAGMMREAYKEFGISEKVDVEDILLDKSDSRSYYGRLFAGFQKGKNYAKTSAQETIAQVDYPDYIKNRVYAPDVEDAAKGFLNEYDRLIRRHVSEAVGVQDEILDSVVSQHVFGETAEDIGFRRVHEGSLRYLQQFFDEDTGRVTDRLQQVMASAIQQAGDSPNTRYLHAVMQQGDATGGPSIYDFAMSAMMDAKMSLLEGRVYGPPEVVDGLPLPISLNEHETRLLLHGQDAQYTLDDVVESIGSPSIGEKFGDVRHAARSKASELSDEIVQAISSGGEGTGKIDATSLRALWDIPTVRRGGIAAGGLLAASLVYRSIKDRTEEDMQGPPLLPGGNPYEQMPSSDPMEDAYNYAGQNGGGVTYRVQARGDFDPQELTNRAELLVDAPVSSNITNSPARVNADPYRSIRETFS